MPQVRHTLKVKMGEKVRAGRLLVLVALLGIASCDDDLQGPDAGENSEEEASVPVGESLSVEDTPFYYYRPGPGAEDIKIPLVVDPSEIFVVTGLAREDLSQRAIGLGLPVARVAGATRFGPTAHRVVVNGASASDVRTAIRELRSDPEVAFVGSTYRTSDDARMTLINRLVVRFESGVTRSVATEWIESRGMGVERLPRESRSRPTYWLTYPGGEDPLAVAAEVNDHPLVDWAEPDRLAEIHLDDHAPTDDLYSDQYYLENSITKGGVPVDINVEKAWHLTKGSGIRVAIVGTGVEGSHPELSSQKAGGACAAGWDEALDDVTTSGDAWEPYGVYDDGMASGDYFDEHETAVAGILVAQHDGDGTVGVAPDAEILSARITLFSGFIAATPAEVADALEWAWDFCDADIVNGSFHGSAPSTAITSTINDGAANGRSGAGTVFVFSAGNGSNRDASSIDSVAYPASLSASIAVGAIDDSGSVANYSPEYPDIVAPSGHYLGSCNTPAVYTTGLEGSEAGFGCNDLGDGDYLSSFSGTSSSAPEVAGAAALLLADDGSLTLSEVKSALYDNADDWGAQDTFGHGKLNITAALDYEDGDGVIESVDINGSTIVKPNVNCTWFADVDGGTSPLTYQWYKNGSPVGTDQEESIATGTSSFTLIVDVEDHFGESMSDTLAVTVSGSAFACVM